jgi:hypothetical protein
MHIEVQRSDVHSGIDSVKRLIIATRRFVRRGFLAALKYEAALYGLFGGSVVGLVCAFTENHGVHPELAVYNPLVGGISAIVLSYAPMRKIIALFVRSSVVSSLSAIGAITLAYAWSGQDLTAADATGAASIVFFVSLTFGVMRSAVFCGDYPTSKMYKLNGTLHNTAKHEAGHALVAAVLNTDFVDGYVRLWPK